MRTRRSPRNQQILYKAIGRQLASAAAASAAAINNAAVEDPDPQPGITFPSAIVPVVRCWDCKHYPKGGRARATCSKFGVKVSGITEDQTCFTRR